MKTINNYIKENDEMRRIIYENFSKNIYHIIRTDKNMESRFPEVKNIVSKLMSDLYYDYDVIFKNYDEIICDGFELKITFSHYAIVVLNGNVDIMNLQMIDSRGNVNDRCISKEVLFKKLQIENL
jgi:hypothetical protein